MKEKQSVLGSLLAAVTGLALLIALFVRAFLPRAILPRLDLPAMVLLCLTALVLDYYITRCSKRNYLLLILCGALVFGLFPFAAGFAAPLSALTLALLGAVVFPAATFLFDITAGRMRGTFFTPVYCALGLYLAAQGLMGLI